MRTARYSPKHAKPSLHPTRSTLSAGLTAVLLPLCMASPALATGEASPTASPASSTAPESSATPTATMSAESTPTPAPTASSSSADSSAAAPAKAETVLRISGPGGTVQPGAHTIGVRLLADGRGVKDGYVRLERKLGDGSWEYAGRLLTKSDGLATGKLSFSRSTRLRAVYQGSQTRTAATSREIVVTVAKAATFRQRAVQVAAQQNGKPYRYGSVGPNSFDCSGLVKYAFARAGKNLPRTSRDMFRATQRISASQKKPGDLIFMSSNGRIGHVAVYAGNGMMWDAPTSGRTVSKRKIYSSRYYVGRVN